ncbi:MAG: diguanylate cyclase, partial [Deltaproteobacteria bacterium]|nr:diguanylate cyclase [Deltaproteobacteria bacterium]
KAESELRASEERYRHLSLHDSLTGLFNRAAFTEHLIVVERDFVRYAPVSILVLDVNRLKLINDTMGHAMGDNLLVTAADAIGRILPPNTSLFRTGGDEFCAVALRTKLEEAEVLRDRINESASVAEHGPAMLGLGFSIGLACTDQHPGMNVFEIFQCADDDMYHDKLIRNGSSMSHIETLIAALDAHDFGSEGHLERVARISEAMAERLRLPEPQRKNLLLLARLHDLGKVGVQEQILHKKSPLSDSEVSAVRAHVEIGHRIAARSHDLARIARLILHHHENWDGSGYPLGLKGEAIPVECRVLRIADAFDAMTSVRPYRSPRSFSEARAEIRTQAGAQFDPALATIFLDLFEDHDEAARILEGAFGHV